jgi:NAD(P)-dependent dehydrogenase (short-subunit alcohol dehydrogenase family)
MATPAAGSDSAAFRLDGKIAVVTGAAGGYGAATARMFAQLGAAGVVLLDLRSDACDEIVAEVERAGAEAIVVGTDINDQDAVRRAAAEVEERFGRCDILINNAGIVRWAPLEDMSAEDWDASMGVNLRGHFFCIQAFGRLMLGQGAGSIVNVASVAATTPEPFAGAYSPAKAALVMLTRQVGIEWGFRGVRANAVCPGLVTGGGLTPSGVQQTLDTRRRLSGLRRLGQIDELARVIAFLASDASSFINGQAVNVDGGFTQMMLRVLPHPGLVPPLLNIVEDGAN